MYRKILLCLGSLLGLLMPLTDLYSQVIATPSKYAYIVRYDKSHTLMRLGHDYHVVDMDIEWPVVIDSTSVSALQHEIASVVLSSDKDDYDAAMHDFLAQYGTPVTGQLDSLPDDRRFCYVTASATIKSYSPGRYIVYQLDHKVAPQSLNSQPSADDHMICVYDLHTQQCLHLQNLMKTYQFQSSADNSLVTLLTSVLSDDQYNSLTDLEVLAVWPEDSLVGIRVRYGFNGTDYTSDLKIRYDYIKSMLTKRYRNLLKPASPHQPVYASLPEVAGTDSLCFQTDVMPVAKDQDQMRRYLAAQTISAYQGSGTVLVSYVIDRAGKPRDVAVVSSVSPTADRWAASVVRGMPSMNPAMKNGHSVSTRLIRGFRFQ